LGIAITSDGEYSGNGLALAVKLYDLIHSSEYLQRETVKIIQQMRLEPWLNPFLNDLAMYKGMHHDLLLRLPQETNTLCAQLRLASTCFFVKDYKVIQLYKKN
jgi:integrator complex subunit 10